MASLLRASLLGKRPRLWTSGTRLWNKELSDINLKSGAWRRHDIIGVIFRDLKINAAHTRLQTAYCSLSRVTWTSCVYHSWNAPLTLMNHISATQFLKVYAVGGDCWCLGSVPPGHGGRSALKERLTRCCLGSYRKHRTITPPPVT